MRGFSGLNRGANARLVRGKREWEKRVGKRAGVLGGARETSLLLVGMKGSTNRLGETVGWLRSSVGSPLCPLFGSNITQTELFLQLVLPLLPFFLGRASPAQCRVWFNKHSLPATRTTRKKRVGHTNLLVP
jgi:hypothetical protein